MQHRGCAFHRGLFPAGLSVPRIECFLYSSCYNPAKGLLEVQCLRYYFLYLTRDSGWSKAHQTQRVKETEPGFLLGVWLSTCLGAPGRGQKCRLLEAPQRHPKAPKPSHPQRAMLTLVSSWALARLSTAMAKNTFSSVSGVTS